MIYGFKVHLSFLYITYHRNMPFCQYIVTVIVTYRLSIVASNIDAGVGLGVSTFIFLVLHGFGYSIIC